MHTAEIPNRLLSYTEVQAALGLGRTKTSELVLGGSIASITIGRRRLMPESAVASFVADRMAGNC